MAEDGSVVFKIKANVADLKKDLDKATDAVEKSTEKWDVLVEKHKLEPKMDTAPLETAAKKASESVQASADAMGGALGGLGEAAKESAEGAGDALGRKLPEETKKGTQKSEKEVKSFADAVKAQFAGIGPALKQAFSFSLGTMIADGLKAAGKAIVQFGKESVGLASDLQEVQNVVDVTFGDDAAEINRWSKNANKSFGLTELQAKQYTSTLGAMMKSSGLTGKAVTAMSKDMAGLAADMASFYNLDMDTAFEKIRAGISGETEPLKALGINMSVANLEAYALSQGITKSYEAMSQAEQVTLRYNYLMQATSDAQGDFARTTDSLANAQRVLEGNIATLKANIGEALLPVVNGAVEAINGLFKALEQKPDLEGQFSEIEQQYDQTVEEINSKEFTAQGLIDELERLKNKTSLTRHEQLVWQKTLEELVDTVPELSKYIDLENGKLLVSTDALRENTKSWADNARAKAQATAMQEKYNTLAEEELAVVEKEVAYSKKWHEWQKSEKDRLSTMDKIRKALGLEANELQEYVDDHVKLGNALAGTNSEASDLIATYNALTRNATELSAETYELLKDWEGSSKTLAAHREETDALAEAMGYDAEQTQAAADAMGALTESQIAAKDAMQEQLNTFRGGALSEALTAIQEYEQNVRASMRSALDSVGGSFEAMTVVTKESAEKMRADMLKASADNLQYWQDYQTNYETVQRRMKGLNLSEDVLKELSDGSEKSATMLAAMATATDDEITAMVENAGKASGIKDSLAGTMADTQLALDGTYQTMRENYNAMIDNFNQSSAAYQAVISTGNSVDNALAAVLKDVTAYAAAFNEQYAQIFGGLNLPGLNVPTAGSGGRTAPKPKGGRAGTVGKYADGLDYVPYDDFPAYLHKGEMVLTADEAAMMRDFGAVSGAGKSGGASQGLDYNALAQALSGAANAGGDVYVYVGGEQVEAIVSRQQADSYKALERSGWRAGV